MCQREENENIYESTGVSKNREGGGVNEGRGLNELKKEVLYEGRGGKIVSLAKMVNGQSLGFLSPYVWIDGAKVV